MHVECLFKKIINIIIQLNYNDNIKNFLEIKINFLKILVSNFAVSLCLAMHDTASQCKLILIFLNLKTNKIMTDNMKNNKETI